MEKTSREYAKELANDFYDHVDLHERFQIDGYIEGYMSAISETEVIRLQEENRVMREACEIAHKAIANLLSGKPVRNIDEHISFIEKALKNTPSTEG